MKRFQYLRQKDGILEKDFTPTPNWERRTVHEMVLSRYQPKIDETLKAIHEEAPLTLLCYTIYTGNLISGTRFWRVQFQSAYLQKFPNSRRISNSYHRGRRGPDNLIHHRLSRR